MQIETNAQAVEQIVQSIFATMMNMRISATVLTADQTREWMTSWVRLEGDWNGAVSFECDREQACYLAAQFMAIDPADTEDSDIRDVLGELANMIGGNLKAIVAKNTRLSLPSVVEGRSSEIVPRGCEVSDRIGFSLEGGGHFWVTVLGYK